MNNITLTGRMVKDPELKYTTNNTAVLTFTLAVSRNKEETDWIPCVAWKTTAELIAKHIKKGDKLGINGRIQSRNWETQNGEKRTAIEIIANEVEFLTPKREEKPEPKPAPEPGYYDGLDDDNAPF